MVRVVTDAVEDVKLLAQERVMGLILAHHHVANAIIHVHLRVKMVVNQLVRMVVKVLVIIRVLVVVIQVAVLVVIQVVKDLATVGALVHVILAVKKRVIMDAKVHVKEAAQLHAQDRKSVV